MEAQKGPGSPEVKDGDPRPTKTTRPRMTPGSCVSMSPIHRHLEFTLGKGGGQQHLPPHSVKNLKHDLGCQVIHPVCVRASPDRARGRPESLPPLAVTDGPETRPTHCYGHDSTGELGSVTLGVRWAFTQPTRSSKVRIRPLAQRKTSLSTTGSRIASSRIHFR